ncbi:MFS transporter [Nocardia higoensis]|uniref:MFS transporter n=1 Tax=Nocardia higoensis TaxID=228599 RepID=UPI000314D676|nr:MFS transporter [Nocardia higoensis]
MTESSAVGDRAAAPAAPPTGKRPLPPIVWLMGAVTFLVGTTEMMVAGILPEVSEALDVSVAQAGSLITVFALGMMIGSPLMALATLRLPRRAVLITALVLFAAGHVIGALTDVFALALVGRLVSALGTGTFWAVGALVATAAAGRERAASAMGVMIGGLTIANVIGVPLGAALGKSLGWQGPFWILAVLSLVAVAVIVRQVPADHGGGSHATVNGELAALRKGRLWLVYLSIALAQAAVLGTYSYISPMLTDRAGLAAGLVPLAMLGYGAGTVVGSALGGRLGDSVPWRAAITGVLATTLVLTAITLWATNSAVAVVLVIALGVAGLVCNPILSAQVVAVAGPGRPLAMALSTSAFNVGIAGGSALAGVALSSGLEAQGPPLVGLVFGILALVPLVLLARGARKHA